MRAALVVLALALSACSAPDHCKVLEGDLVIGTGLTAADEEALLGRCLNVTGTVVVDPGAQGVVAVGGLTHVGSIRVLNAAALTELRLDTVQTADIVTVEASALSLVSFGSLLAMNALELTNNDALQTLAVPNLEHTGVVRAHDNPLLPGCFLEGIAERSGRECHCADNGVCAATP